MWSFGRPAATSPPQGGAPATGETPSSTPSGSGGFLAGGGTAIAPPALARRRRPRLRAALARGVKIGVTSPFAGTARARLTLDGRAAKRLRLSKRSAVVVATGSTKVTAGRQGALTLRFTKVARRVLRRSKSLTLTLQSV